MKAILWKKYGPPDGLQLGKINKPVPDDDQVLIRILATTVTAGDCELRRLQLPLGLSFPIRLYAGFTKPKRIPVLGQELAEQVEILAVRRAVIGDGRVSRATPDRELPYDVADLAGVDVLLLHPREDGLVKAGAMRTGQ